jgi:hypothetical protein
MANLDRRIEALERLYATGEDPTIEPPDLEERRAALIASMGRAKEKAREEAAAGDSRRLRALEDLERTIRERRISRLEARS